MRVSEKRNIFTQFGDLDIVDIKNKQKECSIDTKH